MQQQSPPSSVPDLYRTISSATTTLADVIVPFDYAQVLAENATLRARVLEQDEEWRVRKGFLMENILIFRENLKIIEATTKTVKDTIARKDQEIELLQARVLHQQSILEINQTSRRLKRTHNRRIRYIERGLGGYGRLSP
jgi:hypothetical protein